VRCECNMKVDASSRLQIHVACRSQVAMEDLMGLGRKMRGKAANAS
jgi:hypothetical protein